MEIEDSKETYQLIQLTPEDISNDWEAISEAISASLPPTTNGELGNAMNQLLSGEMKCWVLYSEEEPWVLGTIIPIKEPVSGIENLLLYSVYGYKPINLGIWTMLLSKLKSYAKSKGYKNIIAFSNVERIIRLIGTLGGDASFRLLKMEV